MATAPNSKAKQTPITEIKHGDVVVFRDFHSGAWQRAIVYNPIVSPKDTKKLIGFRVLPVETISIGKHSKNDLQSGKELDPSKPATIENENGSIVENAGGRPKQHKAVVSFNMRTFAIHPKMTGSDKEGHVWTMGSYWGSPYLVDLMNIVGDLYKKQQLFFEGTKMDDNTKMVVVSSKFADGIRRQNFNQRMDTLDQLRDENRTSGTASMEAIARSQPAVKPARKPVAAPAPKGTVDVAKPFAKASKEIYDVDLRTLVTGLSMGGERSGLAALRGGASNENEETLPVIDPATGNKDKKLTTLREAWTYLKAVSPDLDPKEIVSAMKNNMTLNGATKVTKRLGELVEELDQMQKSGKDYVSQDYLIDRLIDHKQILTIKGP